MEAASIWAPPRCQALCQALGLGRDEMMWSLLSQASQGRTMWWVFRKGKCRLLWEHVAIGFTLTEGERGASFLSKSGIEVKSLKLFRGVSKGRGWGKHSSLREENVQRPWDGEEDWMKSQMAEMLEKLITKVSASQSFVPSSDVQKDIGCSVFILVETYRLGRVFKRFSACRGIFLWIPQSEDKQHHWGVFSESS